MSTQDRYEKIEGYLSKTLSEEEMKAFEQELQSDPELAQEVRLFSNVDKAILDKPALDFQKLIQEQGEIFQQKEKEDQTPIRSLNLKPYHWAIAAAITLLLISTFIILNLNKQEKLSGPELFAQNLETYNLDEDNRSSGNDSTIIGKAIQHYKDEKFVSATELFYQLSQQKPDDILISFYLANAYLNQKPPQLDEAQSEFKKVINDDESLYVRDSKWYVTLILLQKEQIEEAKVQLEEFAKSSGEYGMSAKEILTKLD